MLLKLCFFLNHAFLKHIQTVMTFLSFCIPKILKMQQKKLKIGLLIKLYVEKVILSIYLCMFAAIVTTQEVPKHYHKDVLYS